jgi:sensor c-di-GMP phosphodiesterase-like protein
MVRRAVELLAFVVPVLLVVLLAYERCLHDQKTSAAILANAILSRSQATSDQLKAGFMAVQGVNPSNACSDSNIIRMRKIALASPYLAGFGYIVGNALQCSSFGSQIAPVDVGAADYVSATGYAVRSERELDIAPGTRLLLSTAPDGFTGFFHPSIVATPMNDDADVSLGVVGTTSRMLLMSTGTKHFDWATRETIAPQPSMIVKDGYFVAIHKSAKWDYFVYAAMPVSAATAEFHQLLPLALIVGLFLGAAGFLLVSRVTERKTSIDALLKAALRSNQIHVEYQPIVDLKTGEWVGAEVLARWRLDDGQFVSPDVFIPIAEEYGLIGEVTSTVITLGLGHIAPLIATRPNFFLSINISASDLENIGLAQSLEEAVRRCALLPRNVHVEITERRSVSLSSHGETIAALRQRGFKVGTDDFGVGFSNLGYLNDVPLDYVKIDRSLLANAANGERPLDVVETVVRLARARGIEVIAEGVETEAQRARLVAVGVTLGQGWLFARSMTALEFAAGFARAGRRKEHSNSFGHLAVNG